MRGIKVGNIAVFRKTSVCIISEVIRSVTPHIIVGIDCNNNIHEGTPDNWKTILGKNDKLKSFEEEIFDNIISSREIDTK